MRVDALFPSQRQRRRVGLLAQPMLGVKFGGIVFAGLGLLPDGKPLTQAIMDGWQRFAFHMVTCPARRLRSVSRTEDGIARRG
jgi:hypothetical protein